MRTVRTWSQWDDHIGGFDRKEDELDEHWYFRPLTVAGHSTSFILQEYTTFSRILDDNMMHTRAHGDGGVHDGYETRPRRDREVQSATNDRVRGRSSGHGGYKHTISEACAN